jgi:hypothetical protein
VATLTDSLINPLPGSSFLSAGRIFPSLTVASDGTLCVAWSVYTQTSPTTGHGVVLVTKSTDSGLRWSAPVVAGNLSGRSAFFASVMADPSGNVDLAFLALDDQPFGTAPGEGVVHYDAYSAQSTDGGGSFSSPLKVSTATSDPDGLKHSRPERARSGRLHNRRGRFAWRECLCSMDGLAQCHAVSRSGRLSCGDGRRAHVITQCPTMFGNTDIFLGMVSY